jgi:hypothetical protein
MFYLFLRHICAKKEHKRQVQEKKVHNTKKIRSAHIHCVLYALDT